MAKDKRAGNTGAEVTVLEAVEVDTTAIQSNQAVPAQDSAANILARDVIGNKTDSHNADSLYAQAHELTEHTHSVTQLYPVLASPVTLTKAAGAYAAFPAPTEIIPAATIALDFDIHWAIISAIDANGDFVIRLYQGGAGSETAIATISVVRNAVQSQEGALAIITPLIAAGVRISGALSSENAGADSLAIKLQYHTY